LTAYDKNQDRSPKTHKAIAACLLLCCYFHLPVIFFDDLSGEIRDAQCFGAGLEQVRAQRLATSQSDKERQESRVQRPALRFSSSANFAR
jgi:hypothetical protein